MTPSLHGLWPLVIIVSVGVFLFRFSFFWAMEHITLTPAIRRVLAAIPAAVLPAIVIPAVVFKGSAPGLSPENLRLWAAAMAVITSWKTGNLFATIGVGLASLWLLQWLVG